MKALYLDTVCIYYSYSIMFTKQGDGEIKSYSKLKHDQNRKSSGAIGSTSIKDNFSHRSRVDLCHGRQKKSMTFFFVTKLSTWKKPRQLYQSCTYIYPKLDTTYSVTTS